jgi:hypothetical protein
MALLEKALIQASDPDAVEGRVKGQIEEVVRAYRHSWDIYSELLQNSVDAINRRFRILNDPDFYLYDRYRADNELQPDEAYKGRIHISVHIPNRTIEIYDNGAGIRHDKIEEFLLPKGGDKIVTQEYGFKGYGLTFVAFISDEFLCEACLFMLKMAEKQKLSYMDFLNGYLHKRMLSISQIHQSRMLYVTMSITTGGTRILE